MVPGTQAKCPPGFPRFAAPPRPAPMLNPMPEPSDRAAALDAARALPKAFILGCAKSGTTWAQNILAAHPQAAVAGEGAFAWRLAPLLVQAIKQFNEGQRACGQPDIATIDDRETIDLIRAAIDLRWARYVEASPAWRDGAPERLRIVIDKTPQHTVGVRTLELMCPGARYIHMVRDPRDAAVSAWFHFGQSEGKPFEQFIAHYIGAVWSTNIAEARRAAIALRDRWLEVRYEQLLDDPRRWGRAMLEHLDLAADDETLARCLDAASFRTRSGGREPGEEDRASFYRRGVAGDWREHIDAELARRACEPVATLMTACGYAPSAAPPRPARPLASPPAA